MQGELDLMNVEDVAAVLGVSVGRVRQLAQKEAIKAKKVGRDWVFVRRDVDEFASRHRRPGRPSKD